MTAIISSFSYDHWAAFRIKTRGELELLYDSLLEGEGFDVSRNYHFSPPGWTRKKDGSSIWRFHNRNFLEKQAAYKRGIYDIFSDRREITIGSRILYCLNITKIQDDGLSSPHGVLVFVNVGKKESPAKVIKMVNELVENNTRKGRMGYLYWKKRKWRT